MIFFKRKPKVEEPLPTYSGLKIDYQKEAAYSSVRSEAMLKVLLWNLAELQSKQGWFGWIYSPRVRYNKMMKESLRLVEEQVEQMDKYV